MLYLQLIRFLPDDIRCWPDLPCIPGMLYVDGQRFAATSEPPYGPSSFSAWQDSRRSFFRKGKSDSNSALPTGLYKITVTLARGYRIDGRRYRLFRDRASGKALSRLLRRHVRRHPGEDMWLEIIAPDPFEAGYPPSLPEPATPSIPEPTTPSAYQA